MPLEFAERILSFPPVTGRRQRLEVRGGVVFGGNVRTAQAVMKGFNVQYNNGDHHILELEIDIDTLIVPPNTVRVFGDFVFRDSSGTFDDPYSGFINIVIMADVA